MDRKSHLIKEVMRKSSIIDGVLYSKYNLTLIEENFRQLNDALNKLLSKQERNAENQ